MDIYRNISQSFWTDRKVVEDFTPEDRYMYLYLLTNTHTTLCGCYEVSLKQMAKETGYNTDTIERLLERFEQSHEVIKYVTETQELLIINWHRYNWSESFRVNRPLAKSIQTVKHPEFRNYLLKLYQNRNSLHVEETTVPDQAHISPKKPERKTKQAYGEYGWVKLTEDEYERLIKDLGQVEVDRCIKYIDESAQGNGNKNKWKDWNLVVRRCNREQWGYRSWSAPVPTQTAAPSSTYSPYENWDEVSP